MQTIRVISLIVTMLVALNAGAQKLLVSIPGQASYMTTDQLGNLYVVFGDELAKYSPAGEEIYRYSDKSLGNISFVDANNAMKIVVFYRDQLLVAILDNTLSVQGKAHALADKGFNLATLVCRSQRENLWIFDLGNFELLQTDMNLNVLARSGNLTQILGSTVNPDFILERNNKVYMGNRNGDILVFDNFGTYQKTLHLGYESVPRINGPFIDRTVNGQALRYDQTTFADTALLAPASPFKAALFEEKHIYLLHEKSVDIFSQN